MSGNDFSLSGAAARFADFIAVDHIVAVGLDAPLLGAPRLKACGHCGAGFLPRQAQRFCSRSCAALARPPRGKRPRTRAGRTDDDLILRLLELSPFERNRRGWRFGTKTIKAHVIARLIASRRVVEDGDTLRLARPEDIA